MTFCLASYRLHSDLFFHAYTHQYCWPRVRLSFARLWGHGFVTLEITPPRFFLLHETLHMRVRKVSPYQDNLASLLRLDQLSLCKLWNNQWNWCTFPTGWLEPLLSRIAENKSNVVTPVIDVIDDSTLRYQFSSAQSTSVGGFDWNLQFNWHAIPDAERRRRKSVIDPVRSVFVIFSLFLFFLFLIFLICLFKKKKLKIKKT